MRDGQVGLEVKDVKQKKFEENLAELETIVQSLENGEIVLEIYCCLSKGNGLVKRACDAGQGWKTPG